MNTFISRVTALCCVLLLSYTAFGHGVQLRWNIVPSTGAIRVWIEHWHGATNNVSGFPLVVTYTVGSTTTTQTYLASGYVNNTSVSGLPDGGGSSTLLSLCSSQANIYNNWVYWDFNPPACNTPVSLTIVAGTAVTTEEACTDLYPQTIVSNFNDNSGPAINCQNVFVAPQDTVNCSAIVSSYGITATDACGGNVSLSYSIAEGTSFSAGITPVTVTASDQYGNINTCTFNVTVGDVQPPTVLTQNLTLYLGNAPITLDPNAVNNGSFDNVCGGISSLQLSPGTLDCDNVGTTNVMLSVTDLSGNVATAAAIITLIDTITPSLACPSDITVNAAQGECAAAVTFNAPVVTDNCANSSSVTVSQTSGLPSGSAFPVGTTTNTFVVTDGSGNSDTCSFTITVNQPAPLSISAGDTVDVCTGETVQLISTLTNPPSGAGAGSGSGNNVESVCIYDYAGGGCNFTNNLCIDNYFQANGTYTSSAFTINGTPNSITFKLYYTDCDNQGDVFTFYLNGNAIGTAQTLGYSCTCNPGVYPQYVTLNASQFAQYWNSAGSNTLGVNISMYAVAGFSADVSYTTETYAWTGTGLSDATVGNPTVNTTTSGWYYVEYTSPSNCVVTDSVYVNVNPLPTVSNSNLSAVSYYASPFALSTGSPSGGMYSGNGVSNNVFDPASAGLGTHTITYTYTDANGCTNTATGTIEVIPCNISTSAASVNVSCPGGSDGSIDLSVSGSIGNYTVNWTGLNGYSASQEDISGLAAGTYTAVVVDSASCTDTISHTVGTTPDNTAPTVITQNITVQLDNSGNASITPGQIDNGSTDACGISTLSLDVTTFDCSDAGSNSVILTVTDVNGNTATASATVTVEDNVAPTAIAQNLTIQLNNTGNGSVTASQVDNGSNDACGVAILALDVTDFDCSDVGSNTVTLTVTDNNGNTNTATAIVTVEDMVAPVASCQSVTATLVNGVASVVATQVDNGSSDACGIASLSLDEDTWTCEDIGDHTVTLTVTDNNGNISTCEATVTVAGQVPTCSITSVPANNTYTGGDANIIYLGYGPQSTTLSSNVSGGSSFSYEWTGSNLSCTSCASPVFTPTSAGTYTFDLTVTNENGCETVSSIVICVRDIRVYNNNGSIQNNKVYLCHVPNGNNSNPQTLSISVNAVSSHLGNHAGDALGQCGTSCEWGVLGKGAQAAGEMISDEFGGADIDIILYPNPSAAGFSVAVEGVEQGEMSLIVYDMAGNMVEQVNGQEGISQLEFGSRLAPGLYMVRVTQGQYSKVITATKI